VRLKGLCEADLWGPAVEANTCAGFIPAIIEVVSVFPGKSWYLQTNCRIVLSVSATEWDAKRPQT
jgi:hypothetical protein